MADLNVTIDTFTDATVDTTLTNPSEGSPGGFPFTDAQRSVAFYGDYAIDSEYDWASGLMQAPVAGPPGSPSVLIQVHAPYSRKLVFWRCQRKGLKPLLPAANTSNANEVLATWSCTPSAPMLSPTGDPQYRVSGTYAYYNVIPLGTLTTLPSGALGGIDTTASSVYDVTPYQFNSDMLISSAVPGGLPFPPGY